MYLHFADCARRPNAASFAVPTGLISAPELNATSLACLPGAQVLIVEDEMLVSMVLADLLDEFGCEVVGQAATVGEALDLIETGDAFDAAILDVNIAATRSSPSQTCW